MQRFENKVALVTGAASGIGREVAIRLASEGAQLMLCDINSDGLESTAKACQQYKTNISQQICDVGDYAACEAAIKVCIERHGQLNILCNIAGIVQLKHFADISVAEWQRMLNINLSSVFYFCQLAMPHLITSQGNIVNLASSAGLVGQAYTSAYSATKAAVVSLSKSLAIEFSSNAVRVNALCPGSVKTPLVANIEFPDDIDQGLLAKLFPLLEAAEPSEIAGAVAYLASDEARYITGVALPIDGGQVAG